MKYDEKIQGAVLEALAKSREAAPKVPDYVNAVAVGREYGKVKSLKKMGDNPPNKVRKEMVQALTALIAEAWRGIEQQYRFLLEEGGRKSR